MSGIEDEPLARWAGDYLEKEDWRDDDVPRADPATPSARLRWVTGWAFGPNSGNRPRTILDSLALTLALLSKALQAPLLFKARGQIARLPRRRMVATPARANPAASKTSVDGSGTADATPSPASMLGEAARGRPTTRGLPLVK